MRIVRLGLKSLLLHKLRSSLTTAGILFGVASVIAMLAVGEGASKETLQQYRDMGVTNVLVRSKKPEETQQSTACCTRRRTGCRTCCRRASSCARASSSAASCTASTGPAR
jgi:ABC-type lipoprotein release transport system permease subunit